MDEFSLIDQWKQHTYRQPSTIKGIGDDGAVLSIHDGFTVTSVDTFVEGIHFTSETMSSYFVGYRCLAANISDIIAMGAIPIAYLVSIVIPNSWNDTMLDDVYKGMNELAKKFRMDLIGGDTTSGSEFVLSITIIGKAFPQHIRYRRDAKPGDIVFVTGTLGDSRAGLEILLNNSSETDKYNSFLINRHRKPQIRSNFMLGLTEIERLAINDISDGLANECHEIADASQVSIVIDDDKIPLSTAIRKFSPFEYDDWKIFGGEDFELLCTVDARQWESVKQIAKQQDTLVTAIGIVEERQKDPVYLIKYNKRHSLNKDGYIHLK